MRKYDPQYAGDIKANLGLHENIITCLTVAVH